MKGLATLPLTAMSKFWGFPIGLVALTIVMPKARASNKILGEYRLFSRSNSTTGVPIIASVSFIRKADIRPMPNRWRAPRLSSDFALSLYERLINNRLCFSRFSHRGHTEHEKHTPDNGFKRSQWWNLEVTRTAIAPMSAFSESRMIRWQLSAHRLCCYSREKPIPRLKSLLLALALASQSLALPVLSEIPEFTHCPSMAMSLILS